MNKYSILNQLKIFILVLIVIFSSGCVEEIMFESSGEVRLISIDGGIHDAPGPYFVNIFYSGDFVKDNRGVLTPVEISKGKIIGSNGESADLFPFEAGRYQTIDFDFQGKAGVSYFVEFTTIEGTTYRSVPQKLIQVPEITNLEYTVDIRNETIGKFTAVDKYYVDFNVDFDVPQQDDEILLKWEFKGEYVWREIFNVANQLDPTLDCYLQDNIGFNKVVIFDATGQKGENLSFQNINEIEVDSKMNVRYCFHLYQKTISREAYNYWSKVKDVIQRSGSLFEAPAGPIFGNLINVNDADEQTLGFFSVNSVDTARVFMGPDDIGLLVNRCNTGNQDLEEACLDCTVLQNSTLERPSYWTY